MDVFEQARKRIIEIQNSIHLYVKKAFEENEDVIHQLQTEVQLFQKGEDSTGSIIRPAYRPMTIRIKKKKGQPFDRVTLRDTGEFHKSIQIIATDTHVEITTSHELKEKLFEKYGDDILGIQKELLEEFTKTIVLDVLQTEIKNEITKS